MAEPQADLNEGLSTARARAVEFDQMIYQAVSETAQQSLPSPMVGSHVRDHYLLKWDLVKLFDSYKEAGAYPLERLPQVTDRAIDLKLQFYFVADVNLGLHNHVFVGTGFDTRNPENMPRHHLIHLCLMQAWIGQLRVLWERLMTLVYFLEEGEDPRGRSIRKRFFDRIESWHSNWRVLAEWQAFIDNYDRIYRTPEYHNRSSMRKALFEHQPADPNSILSPLSPIMNGFWEVLIATLRGEASNVVRLGRTVDPDLGPPEMSRDEFLEQLKAIRADEED
jgi:hypothetical protein